MVGVAAGVGISAGLMYSVYLYAKDKYEIVEKDSLSMQALLRLVSAYERQEEEERKLRSALEKKEQELINEKLKRKAAHSSQGFFQNKPLQLNTNEIAGYEKQLERLIREAFYSRAIGRFAEAYGIQHAKGVLLYGPPGTGKTNIARGISKSFAKVTLISGPELKHPHIGVAERNLRNLFSTALAEWNEKGLQSELHVFIFDEIDTLFPKRSHTENSSSERSDNSMTSQFLAMLDGLNSPKNVLIIGTSNRIEAIDPALLRPGRMEVHIEIPLPIEKDRLDILFLKTKNMRKNKLIDENVDLNFWASKTDLFSGADIEYLVKKAGQYAMEKNFAPSSAKNIPVVRDDIQSINDLAKVTQNDLARAFDEIKAQQANDKIVPQLDNQTESNMKNRA